MDGAGTSNHPERLGFPMQELFQGLAFDPSAAALGAICD